MHINGRSRFADGPRPARRGLCAAVCNGRARSATPPCSTRESRGATGAPAPATPGRAGARRGAVPRPHSAAEQAEGREAGASRGTRVEESIQSLNVYSRIDWVGAGAGLPQRLHSRDRSTPRAPVERERHSAWASLSARVNAHPLALPPRFYRQRWPRATPHTRRGPSLPSVACAGLRRATALLLVGGSGCVLAGAGGIGTALSTAARSE